MSIVGQFAIILFLFVISILWLDILVYLYSAFSSTQSAFLALKQGFFAFFQLLPLHESFGLS
jgi:hypothetical protein